MLDNAQVAVPGHPHFLTQSEHGRRTIFLRDDDYIAYLRLLGEARRKAGVEIWAYCLMPDHVNFVVTPGTADGLHAFVAEGHRRYAREMNRRVGRRGHFDQARFESEVLDAVHFLAAVRFVELDPVRAKLVSAPERWPWSSVHAHLAGRPDPLVGAGAARRFFSDWRTFLRAPEAADEVHGPRAAALTGRPLREAAE